jgi:hypothetical protein
MHTLLRAAAFVTLFSASSAFARSDVDLTCVYAVGDGYGRVEYHQESQPSYADDAWSLQTQLDDLCRYTERVARDYYRGWRYFTEVRTQVDYFYGAAPVTCQYNAVVGSSDLRGTMEADVRFYNNRFDNSRLAQDIAFERCQRKYPYTNCNFIGCR